MNKQEGGYEEGFSRFPLVKFLSPLRGFLPKQLTQGYTPWAVFYRRSVASIVD
jgi:hypothetical protein